MLYFSKVLLYLCLGAVSSLDNGEYDEEASNSGNYETSGSEYYDASGYYEYHEASDEASGGRLLTLEEGFAIGLVRLLSLGLTMSTPTLADGNCFIYW